MKTIIAKYLKEHLNMIYTSKTQRNIFLTLSLVFLSVVAMSQDLPIYSMYNFNLITVNPAYTGFEPVPMLSVSYRNQWTDMPGAPVNGDITFDKKIGNTKGSYGGQVYFDKLGIERSIGLKGYYSYLVNLSESSTLRLGLSVGMKNYYHDYSSINAYDSNDPEIQDQVNVLIPTAALGFLYSAERFYAGLSMPQMIKATLNGSSANIEYASLKENYYYGIVGYKFPLVNTDKDATLNPYIVMKYVSGAPLLFDYRLDFDYKDKWGAGLGYRNKDAIIAYADIRLGSKIKLAYAYEFPVSQIGYYSKGSSEISLKFSLKSSREKEPIEETEVEQY